MKTIARLFSLLLLVSVMQAKSDVRVTNTEYGFSVKLPEGVSLVHHNQDAGKDSLGNPTKEDTFESSDSDFSATIYVTTYAENLNLTAENLETLFQRFSSSYQVSTVTLGKLGGLPTASALMEENADGTYIKIDVMMTSKGNRIYTVFYIENPESKLDLNGSLFIQSFNFQ